MQCSKCGKELDENAVFCDGCGSFVMRREYSMLPNNGYRARRERRSRIWIVILLLALFAGVLGTGLGYGIIDYDRRQRIMMQRGDTKPNPWDKSLLTIFPQY